MNSCEKIIEVIRNEGSKNNPPVIELGEMISDTECRIGGNDLDLEDLYLAEHLTEHSRTVDVEHVSELHAQTTSSENHSHELQTMGVKDARIRIKATLKKGDRVAVYRISEDKYLVFAKVVSGDVSV